MKSHAYYHHARLVLTLAAAMALSACASVGPKYRRPAVTVPDVYRGSAPQDPLGDKSLSLGERKWSEVFQDEQLQHLIRTALEQNYDIRIAATRILEARAQVGITRADQMPTVSAGAVFGSERTPSSRFPAFSFTSGGMNIAPSWEPDFWGKYGQATEAARAALLSTEWARKAVVTTVVADVASSYFRLRQLDLELEISRRTLASRQESLQLSRELEDRGVTSMLDVRQAEQLVFTAAARIPDLERQIEQQENLISILVGDNPRPIVREGR